MTESTDAPPAPAVGLFGGSFNPPHMAHVLVAAWALAGGEVGAVWVIPSGGHPFGKPLAPFGDRVEMCRRAFACFGRRVRVLDVERRPGVHYTIDTLWELTRAFPGRRWRWIMGSDTLAEAPQWRAFDQVAALAPPLVVPRQGHASPPGAPSGPGDFALPDLSSTFVRELIGRGRWEELRALVPEPVVDWIRQRGLYDDGGA